MEESAARALERNATPGDETGGAAHGPAPVHGHPIDEAVDHKVDCQARETADPGDGTKAERVRRCHRGSDLRDPEPSDSHDDVARTERPP